MKSFRHEPGLPFKPWFKPRPVLAPARLDYMSREDARRHHMPRAAKAGLALGLVGVSLALALLLGLYRDELKALVFVPGALALVVLLLTIVAAFRHHGSMPLVAIVSSLILNTLLLAATALLSTRSQVWPSPDPSSTPPAASVVSIAMASSTSAAKGPAMHPIARRRTAAEAEAAHCSAAGAAWWT